MFSILLPLSNYVPSHLMQQPKSCFIWIAKVLYFHLSSKIINQIEYSNLNHFTVNVRTWFSNDLQIVGQQSGFRFQLVRRLRMQPKKEKFLTPQIKFRILAVIHLPHGLVVRIRRSHRRGPGSIPGVGKSFFSLSHSFFFKKKNKLSNIFTQERYFYTYCCSCLITFPVILCNCPKAVLYEWSKCRIFTCPDVVNR